MDLDLCIIYPGEDGGVMIIYPYTTELSIFEIAEQNVPKGRPYRIVPAANIPEDRTFRTAWEYIP